MEALQERLKEVGTLEAKVVCDACQDPKYITVGGLGDPTISLDTVFEMFKLLTVDGVDLLVCLSCKSSTSETDLKAIAGRVKRGKTKNA